MTDLLRTLHNNPVAFAGLAAASILVAAFGFQLAGYPPCEMCWWQRYPYIAVIGVSALLLLLKWSHFALGRALLALLFATTASIGLFHWGVENGWWEGLTSCSATLDLGSSTEDALAAIMNAPVIRCDQVAWSLFGLSMAGYNMIVGAGLALYMASTLRAQKQDRMHDAI